MLSISQYLMEAKKKIDIENEKSKAISLLDNMINPKSTINVSDFKKYLYPMVQ